MVLTWRGWVLLAIAILVPLLASSAGLVSVGVAGAIGLAALTGVGFALVRSSRTSRRNAVETQMRISPGYLPVELHYIIPLAERHGSEARVAHYDRQLERHVMYGETLSENDLAPLRDLYVEIRDKGHAAQINNWHHGHSGKKTCPSETTWPVYGLLCLFEQLAEIGVAPFTDRTVGVQEPPQPPLDWIKLPPHLRYLAGPAEVYGAIQFENKIYKFLKERMTPDERDELRALRQRYAQDGDAIDQWLDEFSMSVHREAALVYFTGNLLALGGDLGVL